MGDEEEELLGIWGITKFWSLDIDLCNGPLAPIFITSFTFMHIFLISLSDMFSFNMFQHPVLWQIYPCAGLPAMTVPTMMITHLLYTI